MEEGLWCGRYYAVGTFAWVHTRQLSILTPPRNFDFKEKAEVDKYYPQFYHKSDKVRSYTIH